MFTGVSFADVKAGVKVGEVLQLHRMPRIQSVRGVTILASCQL